jgi:NAD-dependent dihydropyrimidine dehydrogenase PreA subunit
MTENKGIGFWHSIPREEIEWFPTVALDRCMGCGICTTSCGRNVYAFDYEKNKPVVVAPQMCMVGCTTCATTCPEDAIDFPSRGYIRQLIKKRKISRKTKDELADNREKFDVLLREITK